MSKKKTPKRPRTTPARQEGSSGVPAPPERFDPETWLEFLIVPAGCVVATVGSLYIFSELDLDEGTAIIANVVFSVIVVLGAFFFRKQLDIHYEVDSKARLVRYRRRFFGRGLRRQVCRFDEVAGVFLTSRYRTNDNRKWREYGLSLQLQNGRKVHLLHPSEENYREVDRRGQSLARTLGAPFWSGGPNTVVKLTRTSEGFQADYRPTLADLDVSQAPWFKGVVVALVLVVATPLVLVLLLVTGILSVDAFRALTR